MKNKPVILIVDDQPQNIELLEIYLVPQGYEIVKAASGEEALEKLSGNQIDLVLLDIIMPNMSGFEVLKKLRADEKVRLLPVVMITALKETKDRVKAIEAGCDAFISKPFDKYELLAKVESLLKIKSLHDDVNEASEFAENVINTVREPLIALDQDLRVVKVSRSFYDFFKVKPEDTVGQLIYDLGNKQWDIPKLRELLETILPQKATFDNYEVEHDFATIGRCTMLLNARQIERAFGKEKIILLAIEDITERKKNDNELNRLNVELEAFSYSVAHDLRAPLRSMEGFSQALMDGWADKLDLQGKDYFARVRKASRVMEELIDAMLGLSHTGRKEMVHMPVDLSLMAKKLSLDLKNSEPQRNTEFIIQDNVMVKGDESLLNIVLQNLFANAWKFTGKHISARIEFGSLNLAGEQVYFVRDDGAGFDMAYLQKLFGAFQRLHSHAEFPGIGIGLVTVGRIISRHGGRVWAESAVEKGATFYFTLS